jgi:hypothetical protein
MAINAACVWEIRSTATASNAGGGFFKTGATGTDFSQQNAPQYSLTGGTSAGAGAVIDHASAAADMVGNGLRIVSGTNATVGWYEVISVVAGVSITVDRNCTTAAGASIVFNVGGALSLAHSSDQTALLTAVGGNKIWIKSGTYVLTGTLNLGSQNGTLGAQISYEGYDSTRGDQPKGSTRPAISGGILITGNYFNFTSLYWTHSVGADMIQPGTRCSFRHCKFINTTTTASQRAMLLSDANIVSHCEAASFRGTGIRHTNSAVINHCYIHDSDIGIDNANAANNYSHCYFSNLIEGCVTYGIRFSGAQDKVTAIFNNTIYGAENKLGTGISMAASGGMNKLYGNILCGLQRASLTRTPRPRARAHRLRWTLTTSTTTQPMCRT